MTKLEKILISIFFIYLLIGGTLLYIKYNSVKDIKPKIIEKEVIKKIENFIPYNNKTKDNILKIKSTLFGKLVGFKEETLSYNNSLVHTDRLKKDYFDFYVKYRNNLLFLELLVDNSVFLQDFEKKYILGRLFKNEKLHNAINNTTISTFKIKNTILGDEKQIIYDKEKNIVRLQYFDNIEQKWLNIYYGKLYFENYNNEYIYNMNFINLNNGKDVLGVLYAINSNLELVFHYINIEYKDNIVFKISNIDYNNIVYDSNLLDTCNKKFQYIAINNTNTSLDLYCRNNKTGISKKINILKSK